MHNFKFCLENYSQCMDCSWPGRCFRNIWKVIWVREILWNIFMIKSLSFQTDVFPNINHYKLLSFWTLVLSSTCPYLFKNIDLKLNSNLFCGRVMATSWIIETVMLQCIKVCKWMKQGKSIRTYSCGLCESQWLSSEAEMTVIWHIYVVISIIYAIFIKIGM